MPQSLSVFAVSLQEHPELLDGIMPLLPLNVKDYYHDGREILHPAVLDTNYTQKLQLTMAVKSIEYFR
jgi:hypothetical protein